MNLFYLGNLTIDSSDSALTEEAVETVNAFSKFWQSIDWDDLFTSFISKSIIILITISLIWLLKKIGLKVIRRTFDTYKTKENYSENRVETLHKLTSNSFQYFLYFVLLYTVLTVIGVPVGSLIAGAGIAGIAIGLGAQGFINDLLTGFFIILERQLDIGNHVIIDDIEGHVVAIGLRTTQIKGFNGTLHFIPNRNISIVSNLSRENMLALIQLRVTPSHDIEKITSIVNDVNTKLAPKYPEIQQGPDILGVADIGSGNLAIKVAIYTLNGSQLKVQADFLEAYIKAVDEAGISLPESPLTIIK